VLESKSTFQMYRLKKLADRNHVKLSKGKREVWYWETITPWSRTF